MAFGSKHLGNGKAEVRKPSRRDSLGAALRAAHGACDELPDEFESRLSKIDEATRQRSPRRG